MAPTSRPSRPQNRLATGIPGLDLVLEGGLIREQSYLIYGAPGTGKTVLANQICFHLASRGETAVFVTLLNESHGSLIQQLKGFTFFDAALVGDPLRYYSGYSELVDAGPDGLLELLHDVIRKDRPVLLAMDGIASAIAAAVGDAIELKQFVHKLRLLAGSYGCTTLLLASADDVFQGLFGHMVPAAVDGLIELQHNIGRRYAVRELLVQKVRGSGFLDGRHNLQITDDGITIYPRTEVRYTAPDLDTFDPLDRKRFDIDTLDTMLGGGLHARTMSLVLGNSGSGKTILGLHFLAGGAAEGERGLYFGFAEPPAEIIAKAEAVGLVFKRYVEQGTVEVLWQLPVAVLLDAVAERILEAVTIHGAQRLVLDGLLGLRQLAADADRLPAFCTALVGELRARGLTTLLMDETRTTLLSESPLPPTEVAAVTGTVIHLRRVEIGPYIYRLVDVAKMRHGAYDTRVHAFEITDDGIRVDPDSRHAEDVFSGHVNAVPRNRD